MTSRRGGVASGDADQSAVETIEEFRQSLLASLPSLIGNALADYRRFASDAAPDDAKSFVAHQAGCRASLAHIHLLVKLAHWAGPSAPDSGSALDDEQLQQLIHEAETALTGTTPDD